MNEAERLLKEALRKGSKTQEALPSCPSERVLAAYLEGDLNSSQEDSVSHHAATCEACLESLLLAQEARLGVGSNPKGEVPESWLKRAKAIPSLRNLPQKKGFFRKNRWLFLALGFLGLSLFIPRYFLQSLFLAALFGAKWVFDSATNRTLIVMYEAWRKQRKEDELIQR